MLTLLVSLLINPVVSNVCAKAGRRSGNCYDDCDAYCLKHAYCELDHHSRSPWPWDGNFCGWAWQAKCVCRTCPGGFCGKMKQMLDKAIPIARRNVQTRIDLLEASLGGLGAADFTGLQELYVAPASCSASTSWSASHGCENAFADNDRQWATRTQGVNSWIYYTWSREVVLHKMLFRNRVCPAGLDCGDTKKMRLVFSDGSSLDVDFTNRHEENDIPLPGKKTTSVTMIVLETYSSVDNGAQYIRFYELSYPRMTWLSQGYCNSGYYAGWDGKGTDSQEHCNQLCLMEPQCTYAAYHRDGKTCARYSGDSCTLQWDPDYITHEKRSSYDFGMEKKFIGGYCQNGYHAGWDGQGTYSQDACNQVCLMDPQCTYAAFHRAGKTCARYSGDSCILHWDPDYITYAKKSNGGAAALLVPSTCTASSQWSNDYNCHNAYENNAWQWATRAQGVGSWIEYDFGQNVVIQKIEFQNRICPNSDCGDTRRATLTFDNSVRTFDVQDRHGVNTEWIESVVTRTVRFRVDTVYSSVNNGAQILRFYGYGKSGYAKFSEDFVPYHEGNHVGSLECVDLDDCKAWCARRSNCRSFGRCDNRRSCWFKDLTLTGKESARQTGGCTTYFKPDFQSDNDGWRKYFGNRNNHIRKPFMLNVLHNMKRYLGDIGYSSSNMVQLVANPQGKSQARMSCSGGAPCYGTEERRWPTKIGFNVNVNHEDLISAPVEKVAALMIHELSHSSAVASQQNLTVTGSDIRLISTKVGDHKNKAFLATRDWTYKGDEVENYAKCYESGQNCPGAGGDKENNRPAANMNMDVPLNNAATYEYWILNTEGKSCVSGDMLVESESSGPIKAGALLEGMKIRGKDAHGNSQWCTVQDIYFNGMGTLFGNFTEEHLVLDDSAGIVQPSGNSSHEHFGAKYTIFTDCPIMENMDGELFTPLAQTFCGSRDFSWSEYLVLWKAIQQVVSDTGIFWFHLDETFTDCKNTTLCGNLTDWRDALPPVCESLMACASSQDDVICDDFEDVAQTFFDHYIQAERVEEIKNAYADYGSISLSVKDSQNEDHLWMWVAIGASGLVVMMAIMFLTWRCFCQKKQGEDENQTATV